ncbi:hypothetical protein QYE76_007084 [Lolium multiflorum]|uniref:TF-B3 domain-containing protein n=1 Tax=Lolium multiflorum TaxID=4521 RepID=A0AAD8RX47_LOLMU|nr:hypothetical protein QYE76_007084 [Lolium multiflorum]
MAIDLSGFKFDFTIHLGMNWDMMRLPRGHMFFHNGWRHFARSHVIEVGHFIVFKYDSHSVFTIKVFDETMCRRHYHSDEDD